MPTKIRSSKRDGRFNILRAEPFRVVRGGDLNDVIDLLLAVEKGKDVMLAIAADHLIDVLHHDNERAASGSMRLTMGSTARVICGFPNSSTIPFRAMRRLIRS